MALSIVVALRGTCFMSLMELATAALQSANAAVRQVPTAVVQATSLPLAVMVIS